MVRPFSIAIGLLAASFLATAGCFPSGSDCVPGHSVGCACADGLKGAQVCRSDGTYGACTCAGAGGGGGTTQTDGGRPQADGGTPQADGGTPQADGGTPQTDGGTPQTDGGTPQTDGGTPQTDGGTPQADGGTPQADGGTPQTDGGTPTCAPGFTDCGGTCVDTSRDLAHCGTCGRACTAGQICNQGACVSAPSCAQSLCPTGTYCTSSNVCAPGCYDDTQCSLRQTCIQSSHSCVCQALLTDCGGACRDLANDDANCGACGHACAANQDCIDGTCEDEGTLCAGYSNSGRFASCANQACSNQALTCIDAPAAICASTSPCGPSPTARCCSPGQFCGRSSSGVYWGSFCCVPGETIPDGYPGAGDTCVDAGLKIGCRTDADCPSAWGTPYCDTSRPRPYCVACVNSGQCTNGQVCDPASGTCVDCVTNADCPASAPACDPDRHTCGACARNADCTDPAKPACDPSTDTCVQCVQDADCPAKDPYCFSNYCWSCPNQEACQATADGRKACLPPIGAKTCTSDADCTGAHQICAPDGSYSYCTYACP